ncbi:Type I inositol 1,4,5-trisphosphate 5-phosphatase [Takifugu flavidus]|uniref:Type I inositol 1,4,5-trisphosphate 5-phosphatase n=1 Tax=Takifugu flavidus TaxID=433684 RepID=A0A5C6PEQ2_9TELE|nr:Type I inositol 1,4,5-trisphosphate 5-phosphatase [Takifugu flavidus]
MSGPKASVCGPASTSELGDRNLCSSATMQMVRTADTNELDKLIFRESDNDRKVVLQLEKKLFSYVNQDVFRENNGTR